MSSPRKRGHDDDDVSVTTESPSKKPNNTVVKLPPFMNTTLDFECDTTLSAQIKKIVTGLHWGEHPQVITVVNKDETSSVTTFDLGEWLENCQNAERIARLVFYDGGHIKGGLTVWNLATIPYKHLIKSVPFGQGTEYLKVKSDTRSASTFFLAGRVTNSGLTVLGSPVQSYQLNVQPPEHLFGRTMSNICYGLQLGKKVVINSFSLGISFSTRAISASSSKQTSDYPVRRPQPISAYDGRTPFALGCHRSLPTIDRDIRKGDFVIVTFTVNSYTWKKIDKDKQHGSASNGPSSPQKKAAEGYTKCVSMNIQDVILLDAGEQEAFEEEIVNDNETGDEPQIM
ncbi:hypothetical protein M422DRAFT_247833 [Sphaerobolus stellatus SS14]|nr:hypothetical protein M422DRAFT_247833 [Sphaerobolus stellatus SS14]